MKLQNLFIKSKIKELTKKHPSTWNNSNVYQLFFYSNAEEFKKYKKILIILYNEFLIEIENNIRSKELTFNLENLKVYDISKKLGIEDGLTLEPVDKLYQRKKHRFARLKNNSANLEIKLKYDNVEETIGVNQELYNMDEIKIITQDKKIYLLSYSNNKISRV
jgi:hypothetical protein